MSNFDSETLTYDLTLFPAKNSLNSAKNNHIFPGKERGYRTLILTILDSPMAEVFPGKCIYFINLGHLEGETEGQSCKNANFGVCLFHIKKTRILQIIFK